MSLNRLNNKAFASARFPNFKAEFTRKTSLSMITRLLSILTLVGISLSSFAQISFTNQTLELTDPTHYSGNGVCVQDANGDGLDDLIILDNARALKIEFQGIDGVWTSYTGGVMGAGNAWGMAAADMNGNGFSDVFSGLSSGNPDYARSNADGTEWTMEDLTGYPLFFQGSSLADFDSDGDLDYYVCADTDESAIWENDGDGNMTYSGTSIIDLTVNGWDGSGNYGSTATDFDLDGDLDLYVAHCRQGVDSDTDPRRINQLFINDGDDNYTEAAADYGLAIGAQSWTAEFADVDNDGDFDVFLTNHDVNNMLFINNDGVYEDIFDNSGLNMSVGVPIQAAFKDLDNDLFLDLIVTGSDHAVYHNNGDNTFTQVDGVFDGPDMESFAVGDLNHDGFIDVYGSYAQIYNQPSNTPDALWINEGNDNHFIVVDLEGTISNPSAVGTVVKAYGPWGQQVREVRAGESYGMVNSLQTHFGLGEYTTIDSLVIEWPSSGIHQVITSPAVDQFLSVVENGCIAEVPQISTAGDFILCDAEMLELSLDLAEGETVLWSTGASTASISVSDEGTYMAEIVSADGCAGITSSVTVSQSPDETPVLSASGPLEFCDGQSITLSSSDADSYEWNVGGAGQSIEVEESGEYFVTIAGACADFNSESVMVNVLDGPVVAVENQVVTIGESASLTAVGEFDEVRWYDQEVEGSLLETGSTFETPVIESVTSFWYEADRDYGGVEYNGAKETISSSTGGYLENSNFYLIFDVYEDMTIQTVKVYAQSTGVRTIHLRDQNGALLGSTSQSLNGGLTEVTLDFFVPVGEGYSLRAAGGADLWRDNDPSGLDFPYAIGDLGSVTGTNVTNENAGNYYYFFYDWKVVSSQFSCTNDRQEVVVDAATGLYSNVAIGSVEMYPNPARDEVKLSYAEALDEVQLILIDIAGRTVYSKNWDKVNQGDLMTIPTVELTEGVYVLTVKSNQGVYSERLSVRR